MTPTEITALAEELEARHRDTWPLQIGMGSLINEDGPRAATALRALLSEREVMRGALEFYANPETYHACGFMFDPPTGGFDEDFSDDHGHEDYPRAMPGKAARQALSALTPKEPNNGN